MRNLRFAPVVLALAIIGPGCATVSFDGRQAARPEQSALYDASQAVKTEFAEEGWGLRDEEPGMARRFTAMLMRGISDEPEQTPVDIYVAALPEAPAARAAQAATDLDTAQALVLAANAAAASARAQAPDALSADADLAATESAAQTALRGARFFAKVIDRLEPELQPVQIEQLTARQADLDALAKTLAGHADAFAERRRAAFAAAS